MAKARKRGALTITEISRATGLKVHTPLGQNFTAEYDDGQLKVVLIPYDSSLCSGSADYINTALNMLDEDFEDMVEALKATRAKAKALGLA